MQAVKTFFQDWQQLLYWVFFKPSELQAHILQITKVTQSSQPRHKIGLITYRKVIVFSSKAALHVLLTIAIFSVLVWLISSAAILDRAYSHWDDILTYHLEFDLFLGIVFGITSSVTCVASGASEGVALKTNGIAGGIASWTATMIAGGLGLGIIIWDNDWFIVAAIVTGIVAGSVIGSLASGLAFSIPWIVLILFLVSASAIYKWIGNETQATDNYDLLGDSLELLFAGTLAFVFSACSFCILGAIGRLRVHFYPFEVMLAIRAYKRSLSSNDPNRELVRSPIYFDEYLILPQPHLSKLLLHSIRCDLQAGLAHLRYVGTNSFQRWATQRAMTMAIESGYTDFFYLLNELLLSCPKNSLRRELRGERENDLSYDTTNVLLAELAGQAASHKRSESLIFRLTSWLRDNKARPYSPTAKIYFDLRNEVQRLALSASNRDSRSSDIGEANLKLLDTGCEETRKIRLLTGGEEFHQFLKISAIALRHKNLRDITEFRNGFSELFEIANPLRPQIIAVFRRLRNAALDAALFLSAEHELTRRDALLKAGGVLEEARELSNDVYEPERSLLLAVIEHWRRMFAVVGGLVAEKQEVETLPNPYVAGRAIRPDDGRLFAGRREEMKLIEEKLQTGVGLVIWGQRRIGKTSILLHLRERLPHDLLPVYLNLQMLMANSTGGFLRAVGNQIVKELRDKLHVLSSPFRRQKSNGETQPPEGGTTNTLAEALLPAEDFDREPYLSFNHLLEEVEQRLLPGQRVLLSFDEFEELEQRVKTGKIEKEIFAYLRGVTQTGRGFALMFAGLHTLEEMTREYWNPFFQSVQTVRIGYLSELDAEQLIRDPMEQFPLDYELEAVNRITEVTRSHPYLTQSLCHNLVNRLNDPLHRSQKATREDVDAVLERTLESSGYYFDDYVWGWSGADEQLALALLAEAGDDAAFSVVEKHLGREAALEATRKLVAREILTERTAAGELVFRFQIPLARLWVRRTKSSARILLERQKP